MRGCEYSQPRRGVGLPLERSTFLFHPSRSDLALIPYFRLRSATGLEAKRGLSTVHSPTNAFHKIDRLQRFLHRFHKSSPSTRISFTLSASAVIGTTRLPFFPRFGCHRILTARTKISSAHPWVFTVTRHSKQPPLVSWQKCRNLLSDPPDCIPRTCFSPVKNWLMIRSFPSTASRVKIAIAPPLGSPFRPVSRFEA